MNIVALNIGFLVSIFLIIFFNKSRLEDSKFSYPLLLFTLPIYYLIFAIYGNDYPALIFEFLAGFIFFIITFLALKFSAFYKFNLLALSYILHGVYDITHTMFFINKGMPVWWPEFCGVIDVFVGLYLINLAFKSRVTNP
jgi:hypothetical protein